MRTLFLGAYGFGNLGDELCLIEALEHFPTDDAWIRTVSRPFTARCIEGGNFVEWQPGRQPPESHIDFERVVVGGGGIFYDHSVHDFMSWIAAGQRSGSETYVHNVAVSRLVELDWLNSEMLDVFRRLDGFSVRDPISREMLRAAGVEATPTLSRFPERNVAADASLAHLLADVDRPILGISMTSQRAMHEALARRRSDVQAWLRQHEHMAVMPIVSVVHIDGVEDDALGFQMFAESFLEGFEVVLPQMLDRSWWDTHVTPRTLKGLIARCEQVLSHRKHNTVHAIGAGVPVCAVSPAEEDNLRRVFVSLENNLPVGSMLLPL